MSLARLFSRQAARAHAFHLGRRRPQRRRHKAPPHNRKALYEPLEPRLLLSGDPFTYEALPDAPVDLTLRLVQEADTPTLQLVDDAGAVVASNPLASTWWVYVLGSDLDDVLTVDLSNWFAVPVTFRGQGHGPAGGDSLRVLGGGSHAASVRHDALTAGSGAVTVDETAVDFTEVEPVAIADMASLTITTPGSSDVLTVDSPAPGEGRVSGTSDGTALDEVTFSNIVDVVIDTGVNDGAAADDTVIIDDSVPANGLDNLSVQTGSGSDTLVGPNAGATWQVTGSDAGEVEGVAFSGVENLTGGAGADTFVFAAGGSLSGALRGGAGIDTLVGADLANVWLISGIDAGTLNGQAFAEIENLVGGEDADTFVFAGGRMSGTIEGRGGANRFDYSASTDGVAVDLGAGTATGTGGFAGITELIGGSSRDTLVGPSGGAPWTIAGPDSGTVASVTYASFENLSGGSGSDIFALGALGSLSGALVGGEGEDTLLAADMANAWEIVAPDTGFLNGLAFLGIETLLGGAVDDVFVFALGTSVTGAIAGGLGLDRVRGADKRNRWRITGQGSATLDDTPLSGVETLEGGADIDEFAFDDSIDFDGTLAGGAGSDTIIGAASATTWTVDGADAGSVYGVSFDEIENLTGAAGNSDTFVFLPGGRLVGLVEGGAAGFDTLAIRGGNYQHLIFTYTGPDSGSVTLDDTTVVYVGLEPVLVDPDTDANPATVEFNLTAGVDQAILEDDAVANNNLSRVRSLNATFEQTTFPSPATSLTINLLGGADVFTIAPLDVQFNASLTVNAGDGSDDITVTTRTGAGAYTINGDGAAGDIDTIRASRVANMVLTDAQLTIGTDVFALGGIERAALSGIALNSAGFTGQTLFASALPEWVSQGPGPLNGGLLTGIPNQPVSGAVQAIAVDPGDLLRVYVGTVGGGIWRSSDRTILFNATSDDPLAIAANGAILDQFAAFLRAHPQLTVEVAGHTDASGPALSNLQLSSNRANSVRQQLINRGIDGARLNVTNFGETRPIARNDAAGVQPLNRRVELLVNYWQPLTDQFPSLSISAIAIHPTNPNTIFAATGIKTSAGVLFPNQTVIGLLRSTDGGATWDVVGRNLLQGSTIHDVKINSAGVLMVATDGVGTAGAGLFRSTNGGDNFTNIATATAGDATPFPAAAVTSIVGDPGDATRFYAAVRTQGVFTSTNSGQNWAPVNLALPNARYGAPLRIELAISGATETGNRPVYGSIITPIRDTLNAAAPVVGAANTIQVSALAGAAGASIFEAGDTVVIGAGATQEVFTVQSVAAAGANIQLTLNGNVQNAHPIGTVVATPGRFRLWGVFRSNNVGANWAQMALPGTAEAGAGFKGIHPGGQGDVHFSMVADAANANVVYIAGDRQAGTGAGVNPGMNLPNSINSPRFHGRLFRGVFAAGGGAWAHITDSGTADPDGGGPLPGTAPHADSREMVFQGIHILEADDGGIYRLATPDQAGRAWSSINHNLALTEFFDVAYDTVGDLIVGGAQDNGVGLQSATGSTTWNSIRLGDGGFVEASGGTMYYSTQNFGRFAFGTRILAPGIAAGTNVINVPLNTPFQGGDTIVMGGFLFPVTGTAVVGGNLQVTLGPNAPNLMPAGTLAEVRPALTVQGTNGGSLFTDPAGTVFDPTVQFVQPFVLNTANSNSLLIGTHYVYESTNNGRLLQPLNGAPVALNVAGTNFRPANGANVGLVRAMIYGGRQPDGMGGFANQADVIYVGTDPTDTPLPPAANRHALWIRAAGAGVGAALVPVRSFTGSAGGAAVRDVAVDPDDWRHIYVLDVRGRIWYSDDGAVADTTTWGWAQLEGNLPSLAGGTLLQRITVERAGGVRVLLAGGEGGLFRRIGNAAGNWTGGNWTEDGTGLPNSMVTSIDRLPAPEDLALAGTLGRGAWTLPNVSQTLAVASTLTLTGTAADDVFYLERNQDEPWRLDVFHYLMGQAKPATPTLTVPLASIESIAVNAGNGANDFFIDARAGAISVPGGITITGGTDADDLQVRLPTALTITGNTGVQAGMAPESGSHQLTVVDALGQSGTQIVRWTEIEAPTSVAAVIQDVNTVREGMVALAAAFRQGLANALDGVDLAGLSAESLAGMLNGLMTAGVEPKDLPFLPVSQVAQSGEIQIDNATSVLLRILAEAGLDLGQIATSGTIANPAALRSALQALGATVTLDEMTDRDGDGTADIYFEVQLQDTSLSGIVDLSFSSLAIGGGEVALAGSVEISADLDLTLGFGVDSHGFFITPATSLGASGVTITDISVNGSASGAGRIGFLGVDLTGATIALDPDVEIDFALVDPGTQSPDGLIRVAELTLGNLGNLIDVTVQGDPGDGNADLELTGTFSVSALVPGVDAGIPLLDGQATLSWEDLADTTTVGISAAGAGGEFLKFLKVTTEDVIDQLESLRGSLNTLSQDSLLGMDVSVVRDALDDVLDVVETFNTEILNPLTSGGTATFPTAQELIVRLASVLGIDLSTLGLAYNVTTQELTYNVNLDHTFATFQESLDFGFDAEPIADLSVGTNASFDASVAVDFILGIDIGDLFGGASFADAFFLRNASVSGSATLDATNVTAVARLGFLDVQVQGGHVITPTPFTFTVPLSDPDGTDAGDTGDTDGGRITLQELFDSLSSPGDLLGSPVITGSVQADLPLASSFLGITASAATTATITMANLSDPDTLNVALPPIVGQFQDMFNFTNMSAAKFVSLLGALSRQLDALRNSETFQSLEIPFVQGAIDQILDLAESFSDGLLFNEGADDAVDGANRLATDLNAALAQAGLDRQIVVQGGGTTLTYEAIDPSITGFQLTGNTGNYARLGLSATPTASALSYTTGSLTTGRLDLDTQFTVTIHRGTASSPTQVTVAASDTTDNPTDATGIGNDTIKLVRADNSATFETTQGLVFRLQRILGIPSGIVNYNQGTDALTFNLGALLPRPSFSHDFPIDFDIDLGPLLNIDTDATVRLSASAGLEPNFIIGVYLGSTVPGAASNLAPGTLLATLNDNAGVDIKTEPAITAADPVSRIYGRLQADATFTLKVRSGGVDTTATFAIPTSATASNFMAADLAADLNAALAVAAVRSGPINVFTLSADAVFSITIGATTYTVTVDHTDTTGNTSLSDLVADVVTALQNADNAGTSVNLTPQITAVAEGSRLVLKAASAAVTQFGFSAGASNPAVTALMLPETATGARLDAKLQAGVVGNRLALQQKTGATVEAFELIAPSADPTVRELGFQARHVAAVPEDSTLLRIVAIKDVPLIAGRLSADTTFNLVIGGSTIPVTIYADDTSDNATVLNLVADINDALRVPVVKGGSLSTFTLSADAVFDVQVNGATQAYRVTVTSGSTTGNTRLSDLVADINTALAQASPVGGSGTVDLTGLIVAKSNVLNPTTGAGRIKLEGNSKSVHTLQVIASGNPLALPTSATATSLLGRIRAESTGNQLIITAVDSYILNGSAVSTFVLGSNASIAVQVSRGSQVETKTVTVPFSATTANVRLEDLVADLNDALTAQFAGAIRAEVNAGAIRLRSFDDAITGFQVTSGSSALGLATGTATLDAVTGFTLSAPAGLPELGLTATGALSLTADSVDLLIYVSDPTTPATHPYRVTLDGVTDIAGVISRISTATGGDVTAAVNAGGTGLILTDTTFTPIVVDDSGNVTSNPNPGTFPGNVFRVISYNGSAAGTGLGILAMDSPEEANLDGKIDGRQVSGIRLTDRFFVENATVSADLSLTTPGGIVADASFGFVDVTLSGNASLSARLQAGLSDPGTGANDGRISLTEFIEGLGNIGTLIPAPSLSGLGSANLAVNVAGVPFITLSSASIGLDFNLGDLFNRYPDSQTFTSTDAIRTADDSFTLPGDRRGTVPVGARVTAALSAGSVDTFVTAVAYDSGTNKTTFTLLDDVLTAQPTSVTLAAGATPVFDFEFSGLDELLAFDNVDFSFRSIIDALMLLSQFLSQFEALGGILDQPLPLVNASVNDLLSFASDLADAIDSAQRNPAGSLQLLDTKISEAFGVDPAGDVFEFGLDTEDRGTTNPEDDLNILTLTFNLEGGFDESLSVEIPNVSLGGGNVVDFGSSGTIGASGAADFQLKIGVDLNDPAHVYLYDDTGLSGTLTLSGSDVAFRAALGPFGLAIRGADATITGTAGATLSSTLFGSEDRVQLIDITFDNPQRVDADSFTLAGNQVGIVLPGVMAAVAGVNRSVSSVTFNSTTNTTTIALAAGTPLPAGTYADVTFSRSILTAVTPSLTGSVSADIPIYFPTDSHLLGSITIGDGAGGAGDLADVPNGFFFKLAAGDVVPANKIVVDLSEVLGGITSAFGNMSLLDQILFIVDGIDLVLGGIQDALDGEILGFTLPLVGDSLADGARFIGDFRRGFLADFREAVEQMTDPNANIIKDLLFQLLGPSGLDLLVAVDSSGNAVLDGDGNFMPGTLADVRAYHNLDTATSIDQAEIWWKVKLGQNLADVGAGLGLDLGIPGLGFETEGEINLDIDWELDLGFGLSGADGFFLFIDDTEELSLDVEVTLPGASFTGTLGILEFTAVNANVDGNAADDDTHLAATFGIDIGNSASPTDTRLGLSEIGKLSFDVLVGAEAAVELALNLGIAGDEGGFPNIAADFNLDWAIDGNPATQAIEPISLFNPPAGFDFGQAIQDGLKRVEFLSVELDMGSYLENVVGPIVRKIQEVTEPVQPIIDVITTPIPVISDLGLEITMLDLAKMSGQVDPRFIDAVQRILQIVSTLNSLHVPDDGSLRVPFGDFTIFDSTNPAFSTGNLNFGSPDFDLADFAEKALDPAGPFGQLLNNLPDGLAEVLGEVAGEVGDILKGLAQEGQAKDKFSFPILEEPSAVFGMLLGQPGPALIAYDMAPLSFKFEWTAFFSIFGPLGVSINIEAEIRIDFAFGYDMKGFFDFADTGFRNPLLLANGLYVSDDPTDPLYDGTGDDPPELEFDGGLWAAAELNLGIARGGVGGGIFIEVDFNLFDNDDDGRVRLDELLGNFLNQLKAPEPAERLLAPLAIFDVSGIITAELFAFLKINFPWPIPDIDKKFQITEPITLVDFNVDFFRPPILATEVDGGDLILNVGPFAAQRLLGDTTDFGEHIFVEDAGPGRVAVWSDNLGSDAMVKQIYEVSGTIIASGGEGDDVINLSGVSSVRFDLQGNAGEDELRGSGGGGVLRGGIGDDDLHGGAGEDLIFGNEGSDTVHAGSQADVVFGDGGELPDGFMTTRTGVVKAVAAATDGADELYGEGGNDLLLGAGGADTIDGGADNDLIIGDSGMLTYASPPVVQDTDEDTQAFIDTLTGGSGNDEIYGGRGDDAINGDAGQDTIYGESGSDIIHAGADNDVVFGDHGTFVAGEPEVVAGGQGDQIWGEDGADKLLGGGGNDTIHGDAGDDRIWGHTGADTLYGDADNDTIFGNSDDDTLYGGSGSDYLEGGHGPDVAFGEAGADTLVAGYGSDTLDAGEDGDVYLISARGDNVTELTTAYDTGTSGTDILTVQGTGRDDVFLLRAMADYYFPGLARLHTLIEKVFNSDKPDKLTLMEQAVVNAYNPHDVPGGMVEALREAFDTDPNDLAALKQAVTDHYVAESPDTNTAFVALIKQDGASVERFNYRNMEGLVLNTLHGDDYVVSDDVIAATTINLGLGNDRVQVGQVFRSKRDDNPQTTNIAPDDVFATIEITRGWLSPGVSVATTINGGDGNDEFTVFHNIAVLNLNGGDGDDLFTVRAFALAGSTDSERGRTDMKGDAGADTILYAVNAPVGIDGGDGFDTVRVIGTEFSDEFVVTDAGVFGAGLNISYVNIEKLIVDAAEGNDKFFVLSTGLDVVTELDGGLGSDTFFIGGNPSRAPIPVISNDFKGHSGVVLHSVDSDDMVYDGIPVEGISANVADNEEDFIIVTPSDGVSRVTEGATSGGQGWAYDTYTVRLSRAPDPGTNVVINIVPAGLPPEDQARGVKDLEFFDPANLNSLLPYNLDGSQVLPVLTFTPATWNVPQTVKFRAVQDLASEGTRFAFINHTTSNSSDPIYADAKLLSVKVQVNDDDRAGVLVTPSGTGTTVLEGGFTDLLDVVLTRQPTSDVVVTLDALNDQVTLSSTALTFTTANWSTPQQITLTAASDLVVEGFHTDYIAVSVTSADVDTHVVQPSTVVDGDFDMPGVQFIPDAKPTSFLFLQHKPDLTRPVTITHDADAAGPGGAVPVSAYAGETDGVMRYQITGNTLTFFQSGDAKPISGTVRAAYEYVQPGYDQAVVKDSVVDIYDNDAAAVIITQTDGSTDVLEGGFGDTYAVVLSMAPAAGTEVRVIVDAVRTRTTLEGDARFEEQVLVQASTDAGPQSMTTLTFDDSNWNVPQIVTVTAIDDTVQDGSDTQVFAPELQTVNKIRGPLFINGAAGSGSLSLPAPLMLPGEINVRPSDGNVVAFTAGTGEGALEYMTVETQDLVDKVAALGDPDITDVADLVGKTLEMTIGPGTAVVLDPARPRDLFDRFWLIMDVQDLGGGQSRITLQNPSMVDPGQPNVTAPDATSQYAITALSINFFAVEKDQVDFVMVFDEDSVADDKGALTSSTGAVLGFASGTSTDTLTVRTADLQAMRLPGNDLNALVGRALEITVGPGVGRIWTVLALADGTAPGTKVLTLQPAASGTDAPTVRSEFRIDGGDTRGRITGLGMGPNVIIGNLVQPGGITYADMEVLLVNLGSGDDEVRVDYTTNAEDHTTERDGDFYTLTLLNTGAGIDTASVRLFDGQDGALALDTQAGDDIVQGGASTLPLVVFGGAGADTITTGSGADVVFGDIGRVDYVDGSGKIVTRLGHTVPLNPVNPPVDSATETTLTDADGAFETAYGGLVGLVVEVISNEGHVQSRTITANTDSVLTVDRAWDTTPDSTYFYRIVTMPADQTDGTMRGPRVLWTIDETLGTGDTITAGGGNDVILGGFGGDTVAAGAGNDWVLGDNGRFDFLPASGNDGPTTMRLVQTTARTIGGDDTIAGNQGDDVLIGGPRADTIDGDAGNDLIFGDVVRLVRRETDPAATGDVTDPRFQTLIGTQIYDTSPTNTAGGDLVDGTARSYRNQDGSVPSWAEFQIEELYHSFEIEAGLVPELLNSFGDDYLTGGADHDVIFGQLGNDTIQGDGAIEGKLLGTPVMARREADNSLTLVPSFEAATDGDDYIEGNGGTDVIFGGLGQDDIVGGSSDLFTLDTYDERPDGADMIFGGSGERAGRNAELSGAEAFFAERHARDADMVLADNGDIFRLVGINGTDGDEFLTFNYDIKGSPADGYSASRPVIVRAARLLDYTPGGPDFTLAVESAPADVATNPGTGLRDIGAADEVHGESGDDFVYGMLGNDLLFGDAENDTIIGGYGADWISGGTGDDGILGDDGRIFASRNSSIYGEPLYGIAAIPATEINRLISTPDGVNNGILNVDGALKYTADLTPQNLDPNVTQDLFFRPLYANDLIYGGWGHDSIHSGAGDDAVSGAEALTESYTNNHDQDGNKIAGHLRSDFDHPFNPGNVLGYNPATTKFYLFATDALTKILLTLAGEPTNSGDEWILNFDATEGPIDTYWVQGQATYPGVSTDGDDHLFLDLGHDWGVGGTGRDVMYAGWGDDLLNADDNLNSDGGLNHVGDTNPSYEDLIFGGAGIDVLIVNTNGDRAMDWVGEFNSFYTPFAQFGAVAVSRLLRPGQPEYLYALSKSEGADQTLAAQYGGDPARNGEPFGELGLVTRMDDAWQDQSGPPRDSQAGNIHGGPVDIKNNPGTAGTKPIYLTAAGPAPTTDAAALLTDADLAPVVAEARLRWAEELGGDLEHLAELDATQVAVGNLPDDRLGATIGNQVLIDSDASGYGWFIDLAPLGGPESSERMDLLSVVMHELGHVMGLEHGAEMMEPALAPGMRLFVGDPGAPVLAAEETLADAGPMFAWHKATSEAGSVAMVSGGRIDWSRALHSATRTDGHLAPQFSEILASASDRNGGRTDGLFSRLIDWTGLRIFGRSSANGQLTPQFPEFLMQEEDEGDAEEGRGF